MGVMATGVARDGQRTARLFHALADETRLRILEQLADDEQCVCDAGLVTDRRQGRWIYYTLNPAAVGELREVVASIGAPRGRRLRIASRCCD